MTGDKSFTIEAEIDQKTGELAVKVKGIKGAGCMNVIEQFDAIGKVTKDVHHSEYYEEEQHVQRVTSIKRQ